LVKELDWWSARLGIAQNLRIKGEKVAFSNVGEGAVADHMPKAGEVDGKAEPGGDAFDLGNGELAEDEFVAEGV
jgi:hypothetical protein